MYGRNGDRCNRPGKFPVPGRGEDYSRMQQATVLTVACCIGWMHGWPGGNLCRIVAFSHLRAGSLPNRPESFCLSRFDSCDISFAVLVKIAYISSNWKTLNPDPTSDRSITTFSPDNVLIMKKTFIVIAVVSVLLTVFAACVKEQYPQPDDISAVPEGMIRSTKPKSISSGIPTVRFRP